MIAYFEDRRAPSGEPAAWCFTDHFECLTVVDRKTLDAALLRIAQMPAWTVMALEYELGYLLEAKSAPPDWQPSGKILARFWRFGECRKMDEEAGATWLKANCTGRPAGIGGLQPAISENAYLATVDRIQTLISAGDCYQINYTFPLTFDWFGTPLDLYARLRDRQPVRYGGVVCDVGGGIVSLSPELFVERRGQRLVTRPMKGTAPLDESPEILQASVKNRAENLMIVDLLRNDLGRIAAPGSVRVERLFEIEEYPTVRQMVSEVSAIQGAASFAEVLRALFPCGSITGAPKIRAMQIIGELENSPRALYTGALGWMAPDGDFRLNVAIRTLSLNPGGRGTMGVGSGIVADSDAGAEWAECLLKASFLRKADPGLKLIETLRREEGGYPRLKSHLERLRRSAHWLGFAFDEPALLERLASQPATGLWRVRVLLAANATLTVEAFPLAGEPEGLRFARIADTVIDSTHPLRHHKTTDRALYDQALQICEAEPDIFDLVFLNERGEVAEGARSNVFVERDGVLLTPPLLSGALPGVLRAELLACGQAREEILYPDDLAAGFWLGNALRGLIRVVLRSTG